ncbi:MAG: YvcK family protein [Bryobacterales bacterium]|nr:YvcK family protein [Bryobacterales bacterium]
MRLSNLLPSSSGAAFPTPLRIVCIGGGTGLSTVLKGLKRYARAPGERAGSDSSVRRPLVEITAVVTVTDDGGSSGRLRREFDVLPPGDIRNCLVALSEDEALLSRLFQYRFPAGRGLKGHSFGNLFLTALSNLTGDFSQAVKLSSEVLASYGRIYPSTDSNVVLEATLENGEKVTGETRISHSRKRIVRIELNPARCMPLPETLEAIAQADLISFGPGSLFTSVIPNLLVKGIAQAICRSEGIKAYFVNLMSQPGETGNFTAADHVEAILDHGGQKILDFVVLNSQLIGRSLQRKYAALQAFPVANDSSRLGALGLRVLPRELVAESEVVRHDPDRMAEVVVQLAAAGRRRRRRLLEAKRRMAAAGA